MKAHGEIERYKYSNGYLLLWPLRAVGFIAFATIGHEIINLKEGKPVDFLFLLLFVFIGIPVITLFFIGIIWLFSLISRRKSYPELPCVIEIENDILRLYDGKNRLYAEQPLASIDKVDDSKIDTAVAIGTEVFLKDEINIGKKTTDKFVILPGLSDHNRLLRRLRSLPQVKYITQHFDAWELSSHGMEIVGLPAFFSALIALCAAAYIIPQIFPAVHWGVKTTAVNAAIYAGIYGLLAVICLAVYSQNTTKIKRWPNSFELTRGSIFKQQVKEDDVLAVEYIPPQFGGAERYRVQHRHGELVISPGRFKHSMDLSDYLESLAEKKLRA